MDLSTFISTYTGQAVDVDGVAADTGQCVQLVALYCQKVLGFTLPTVTGAVDLWTNSTMLANFNQITTGNEQAGDITVWGASSLIDSPEYGHTDIVVSPGFTGFDSNWGDDNNAEGYPVAHEVVHTYTDVLGFLRWKGETMETFNEGDRYNFLAQTVGKTYAEQAATNNYFGQQIGQDWKTAVYAIIGSTQYQQWLQADERAGYTAYSGPQLFTKG